VWVWLLAIGSALAGSTLGGSAEETPRPAPKLGVADLPTLIPVDQWWSGPSLMIGMAIALGVLVALVARWGGGSRPAIALSGLAGPLLVAAAYLLAGPGSAGSAGLASSAGASHLDAYRMALIAVAAGLFASALIAAPRRATHDRRLSAARRPAAEPVVDEPDIEPFLADETSTWDGRPTTSPPDTGLLDKGLPDKGPQDKVLLEHGIPNQRRPDEDRPAVGWFDAGLHPAPAPDLRPYVSLAAYPGGEPERSQPATAYQADPTVMGQPERQFDDEYVDWVSEIGLPETTKRGGRHR
jgi:hypothetical protein